MRIRLVDREYFRTSFHCLFEIGVKLGQVIWRKLFPDELEQADKNLIDVCYDLLLSQEYEFAKALLNFATSVLKKHSSDEIRRTFKINLAIACKWSGDNAGCKKILDEEDWSACSDRFKIAVAVLENRFSDANTIMRRIGKSGGVQRVEYEEWPLFMEFRKSDAFRKTYAEVFGEEFSSPQKVTQATEPNKSEPTVRSNGATSN